MTNSTTANDHMTRNEAAEYLRLKTNTLARWATEGRNDLPYFKAGNRVLYRKSDLDAWLESGRRTQTD
jgi:excisionase family DNA binding protein